MNNVITEEEQANINIEETPRTVCTHRDDCPIGFGDCPDCIYWTEWECQYETDEIESVVKKLKEACTHD